MSSNPFSAPTAFVAEEQQIRRERVKITFYGVLGMLIVLCLALLFQGCRHHEAAAENPLGHQDAAAATPLPKSVSSPILLEANAFAPVPELTSVSVQSSAAPQLPSREILYVTKPGDSLSRIAKATRSSVAAIKAANGLSGEQLPVGKILKIPTLNS